MIQFKFTMENVEGSITREEDGRYLLELKDTETGESEKDSITSFEAASILFCSFDESAENIDDLYKAARKVQDGMNIQIIP